MTATLLKHVAVKTSVDKQKYIKQTRDEFEKRTVYSPDGRVKLSEIGYSPTVFRLWLGLGSVSLVR